MSRYFGVVAKDQCPAFVMMSSGASLLTPASVSSRTGRARPYHRFLAQFRIGGDVVVAEKHVAPAEQGVMDYTA